MSSLELFLIAVGLAMDAFAVALCKGFSLRRFNLKTALVVGLYFGVFQAGMPLIGYFLGEAFADKIAAIDHWVAFGLLVFIGGRMIWESRQAEECAVDTDLDLSPKGMLPLAVATSIDALAVGVSFAFMGVTIGPAVAEIGIVTFVLSALAVKLGSVFGAKFKSKAELAGGIVLIAIGLKILLEDLISLA